VLDRLRQLSEIFAIDICAYAIMSNHYHVVLHVDHEKAKGWTERELITRWTQLYKGHLPGRVGHPNKYCGRVEI
jgi:hypothetical protein